MLLEVYGCEVRGGNYEEAIQLLEQPSASVRLKVGRPDITSSVFSVNAGGREVSQSILLAPSLVTSPSPNHSPREYIYA